MPPYTPGFIFICEIMRGSYKTEPNVLEARMSLCEQNPTGFQGKGTKLLHCEKDSLDQAVEQWLKAETRDLGQGFVSFPKGHSQDCKNLSP